MADLQLQHESIDQAVESLQQAGNSMKSNLDQLLQVLTPLRENFQGAAAQAFDQFFTVVHQNESQMTDDITAAAALLDQMHQTMVHADKSAANGF